MHITTNKWDSTHISSHSPSSSRKYWPFYKSQRRPGLEFHHLIKSPWSIITSPSQGYLYGLGRKPLPPSATGRFFHFIPTQAFPSRRPSFFLPWEISQLNDFDIFNFAIKKITRTSVWSGKECPCIQQVHVVTCACVSIKCICIWTWSLTHKSSCPSMDATCQNWRVTCVRTYANLHMYVTLISYAYVLEEYWFYCLCISSSTIIPSMSL